MARRRWTGRSSSARASGASPSWRRPPTVDGGDVWATRTFPTRAAGKSSLYRHEVRRAAVDAVVRGGLAGRAGRRAAGAARSTATRGSSAGRGRCSRRPSGRSTGRRTRPPPCCAGSTPPRAIPACSTPSAGSRSICSAPTRERALRGRPGELIAQRHGAVCRATVDGAVWITPPEGAGRRSSCPPPARWPSPASRSTCRRSRCGLRAADTFQRDHLRRARRRRLPALRLLQRRHEHRPVPAAARGLPLRRRAPRRPTSSC